MVQQEEGEVVVLLEVSPEVLEVQVRAWEREEVWLWQQVREEVSV